MKVLTLQLTYLKIRVHTQVGFFIEGSELELLFSTLTLADFQRDGRVIQSAAYWNSHFTHIDTFNFNSRSGIK